MSEPQLEKPLIAAVWPAMIADCMPLHCSSWSPPHIPGSRLCEPTVAARKIAASPLGIAPRTARA